MPAPKPVPETDASPRIGDRRERPAEVASWPTRPSALLLEVAAKIGDAGGNRRRGIGLHLPVAVEDVPAERREASAAAAAAAALARLHQRLGKGAVELADQAPAPFVAHAEA